MFKGVLWGLGFGLSTGLAYVAYAMYTLAAVEFSYKKNLVNMLEEEVSSYYEYIKPEVMDFELKDNALIISSRSKRIDAAGILKQSAFIKFYLFDSTSNEEEKLLGICRQEIESDHSDEEYTYYINSCSTAFGNASEVNRISVAIGTKR
jgi:hypothetical protein